METVEPCWPDFGTSGDIKLAITRRFLCASAIVAGLAAKIGSATADQSITVVDMMGRTIWMPARPRRIVLLEAHDLISMSLLHPDPASLVVGWAAVDRIDSDILENRLLNGHSMPVVGKQTPDSVSMEGLIGLAPDLVVVNAFMAPHGDADPLVGRLKQFGVPVVFSDASSNAGAELKPSDIVSQLRTYMRMWGELLGAQSKADAFTAFFAQNLSKIASRVSGTKPVTTYLEVQSTVDDCCWAAGKRIWGDLLAMAGGQPLPAVTAPWFQKLSPEYLLSTPHEVYIASGGGWAEGSRPPIGPGLDQERGRAGLRRLLEGRPGFDQLTSVIDGRVYGIWTGLITNLPLNMIFVVVTAKWLHPERCGDIDPDEILASLNREFAAFAIEGPLWASIQPKG
jgi:iron complex transport system substrate-binding protein